MTTDAASQTASLSPQIRERYDAFKARRLSLNLTRGKPSAAQLDLSAALLSMPAPDADLTSGVSDLRNYGGLQGLASVRTLFSGMLGTTPERVVVGNNSSLAMMHDTVVYALLKGVVGGERPWSKEDEIAFLCPVPGYDRHFTICQDYGIKMIPVALGEDGPDMDEVERLVAADASIKGMWCMPKYSNPTGAVYSDDTVERLARMETGAPDFRLFWDNAYAVHHLTDERVELANVLELAERHGNPNRPFVFASTSKITLAGSGLSLFAASKENVAWLLARMTPRTIGPDKLNQWRHAEYLKDAEGVERLMAAHRALVAPKFERVLAIFDEYLSGIPDVRWTRPKGGYFITLDVPKGTARRVVSLAKEAGVELTPAGATYPYGADPDDRTIRIAPTYPDLAEVEQAAEAVALCVLLASEEKGAA